MAKSKSPAACQRLAVARGARTVRGTPATELPRYAPKATVSHKRGQRREAAGIRDA